MVATTVKVCKIKGKAKERVWFTYPTYLCGLYARYGAPNGIHNTTCGHHSLRAERVFGWLAYKIKEVFLGPGRDA